MNRIKFIICVELLALVFACGCSKKGEETSVENSNVIITGKTFGNLYGTVQEILTESLDYTDKKKVIGYVISVTDDITGSFEIGDLVKVYGKYMRFSPQDGPIELSVGDNIKIYWMYIPVYRNEEGFYELELSGENPEYIQYVSASQ